jgi:alkylated DNA repair dioxygenase AlkB
MGFHADDEPELGDDPIIASISLGADRMFHFRPKPTSLQLKHNNRSVRVESTLRHRIVLQGGSILLMGPSVQHYWQHSLPKTKKECTLRINLTFRQLTKNQST